MKSVLVRIGILGALLVVVHVVSAGGFAEDTTFTYRDINELEIDAGMFDVTIESATGNVVRVDAVDIPRGITVTDSERGGRAHVYVRGRNSWFFRTSGDPRMMITVPAGIKLNIENGSGETEITGVRGPQRVQSGSGDVEIVDAGGAVEISTGSGEVSVERIVGDLMIETGSGDIDLEECVGRFAIETASGAIVGRELELRGDSRFDTASGDIELTLRNDLTDFRYRLTTASGDVRWGDVRARGELTGGNGRYSLLLETASGSIDVR